MINESEITIEFNEKDSTEIKEKKLVVDLDDYMDSYSEDLLHLQDYSKKVIEDQIYPLKKDWCKQLLKTNLPQDSKRLTKIKDLIEELDDAVEEYQNEISEDLEED